MKCQKILNLLDIAPDTMPRFNTKKSDQICGIILMSILLPKESLLFQGKIIDAEKIEI